MRKILYITLGIMVLAAFIGVFAFINADKLLDRFIEGQSAVAEPRMDLLEGSDMKLITVGTAAPLPGDRVQTCNVIFVNGQFLIFDVGRGAASAIEKLRLPQHLIEAIFISHWHSDHYLDLPHLVNRSWILGRQSPLAIYGPEPIDSIIGGMRSFLYQDQIFREAHHGQEILVRSNAEVVPHTIAYQDSQYGSVVYDHNGVRVTAFEVDHQPVRSSLGFRVDYMGKSIVLSGDTKYCENIITYAKDADILVHEAVQKDFIIRGAKLQDRLGNHRNATMLRDLLEYHASAEEAAKVAAAAGVKKLILSHLAPTPENPVSRRFYVGGLDDIYKGPILLAEDGDIYSIN